MSGSSQKYKAIAILLVGLSQPAWAGEAGWPRLEKLSDSGVCSEAFEIANSTFRSDHFYLYDVPVVQQDASSVLVLKPNTENEADISGGAALVADLSVFQKIPTNNKDSPSSIYWQLAAKHGERFVMSASAFGWRGDQYTLFAVKDDVTPEKFLQEYDNEAQKRALTPVIAEGWRPPFMLQEKSNGDVWAIDVGAPYVFLSDWNIYSVEADGAKRRCIVHFHPKAKTATALLPAPVRKLAALLDGTLGSGNNEGTLHPTATVRVGVMHTWANVALRPWAALKAKPYNSREKVDAELEKWSHKARSFRALYREISTQYPKAERALTGYYKTQFSKTDDEARAEARQALDIALRTYFVFPK